MYLFDTDVLSNIVKKKPSEHLLKSLAGVPQEMQFTTAITVGEMVYGAFKSPKPEFFLNKLKEAVLPHVRVLPFDADSAHVYGQLRAELEKRGRSVSEPDLRIASIAIRHDLTLITGNIRHFQGIPSLRIENWL